jgi:DNA-binding GntR family transcriptional regulator
MRAGARASAKDKAYEFVKNEILGNTLGAGEFLTEESVAAELGVSRTPVREAFLRLDAEALLTLVPRKGAFVRPTTQREVHEVIEVRTLVEQWATEQILGSPSAEPRDRVAARLSELVREQTDLAERSDAAGFIERDRMFHIEIVAATNNQVLVDLYQRLRDQQLRMGVQAVTSNAERFDSVIREHGAIVEAFLRGSADDAKAALRTHLETTRDVLLAHMGVKA